MLSAAADAAPKVVAGNPSRHIAVHSATGAIGQLVGNGDMRSMLDRMTRGRNPIRQHKAETAIA